MANRADPVRRIEGMLRIRRFEEQLVFLAKAGAFRGHYHVYIGQEATAVTACEQLTRQDMVFTTWRNHGHLLARGASAEKMFAEILGRATGYSRGKSGTLHLSMVELGAPATSAMVGGALPLATGAALGLKQQGSQGIVAAFFGDAALDEGAFYESANLAAVWNVPILYICENNSIPPEKRKRGQFPSSTLAAAQLIDVPRALQIPSEVVDGADADALSECFARLVADIREKGGPRFVEVRCTRWPGNVLLWPELLSGEFKLDWVLGGRPESPELAAWAEASDPLQLYLRQVIESGRLSKDAANLLDQKIRDEMAAAVRFAETSPWPDAAEATTDVLPKGKRS